MQWYREADGKSRAMARDYVDSGLFRPFNRCAIRSAYASPSFLTIIPMQDILGLGKEGRMNVPSTLGGNWNWRMLPKQLRKKDAKWLNDLAYAYLRSREEKKD